MWLYMRDVIMFCIIFKHLPNHHCSTFPIPSSLNVQCVGCTTLQSTLSFFPHQLVGCRTLYSTRSCKGPLSRISYNVLNHRPVSACKGFVLCPLLLISVYHLMDSQLALTCCNLVRWGRQLQVLRWPPNSPKELCLFGLRLKVCCDALHSCCHCCTTHTCLRSTMIVYKPFFS